MSLAVDDGEEGSAWADPSAPPPLRPFSGELSRNLWALAKQIDGLGGEWTYNVFVARVVNFHQPHLPPTFYEPISTFDRLALEALMFQKSAEYCDPGEEGVLNLAIDVFPSFFDVVDGVVPIPEANEEPIGRHTVNIIGVRDLETLYFRHGWSTWGAGDGLGQISRGYIEAYAREMWLMRRCDWGPTADTAGRLLRTSQSERFATLWRRQMKPEVIRDSVTNIALRSYECWSLADEAPAEMIILHSSRSRRVAFAILVHHPEAKISSVSDLFVWPPYRRRGLGTILDRVVTDQAKRRGSKSVETYVWDADVVTSPERPEGFLMSQGYEIERFDGSQATMLGRKSIQPAWIS